MLEHIEKQFNVDYLAVKIFPDRNTMGKQAAHEVGKKLKSLLSKQKEVRIVFAAAPSQNELLNYLSSSDDIDWSKVTAFHMDEYVGLEANAPQRFGNYLKQNIFDKVKFGKVNYIDSKPQNMEEECERYSNLLKEAPIDIICMGIGENGHIAFNDPSVAEFNDPKFVKVVRLEETSRRQQVHDKCFSAIEEVPQVAISLTIPALFSGHNLYIVVPGKTKAKAVSDTLTGNISESCPASILRNHLNATLYLDSDSASLIQKP